MFYIVSYDIPDDKNRNKISQILLDFGKRVQYSVFECIVDETLLTKMITRLSQIVTKEDSIRIYGLCSNCEKSIKILGNGEITQDQDIYIV